MTKVTCKHKFILANTEKTYYSRPSITSYIEDKSKSFIIWLYCEKCGKVIRNEDKYENR